MKISGDMEGPWTGFAFYRPRHYHLFIMTSGMKKKLILIAGTAMIFGLCFASSNDNKPVKKAVFAGSFYDSDPERLGRMVETFIGRPASGVPAGRVAALIAPHAGYEYSGPTAGLAYGLVRGKDYDTVVVIGPSHRHGFYGCSIWPEGVFETPLGRVEVDSELARAIMKASGFHFLEQSFAEEHSVEVQLPFIQKALPSARIVPIVMGLQEERTVKGLAAALAKTCRGKKVLVVASTDMSHYMPKTEAERVDAATIKLVEAMDTAAIIRKSEAGDNFLCGAGPAAAALAYARKIGRAECRVLERTDSSTAGGPVVGYMAAAVVITGAGDSASAGTGDEEEEKPFRLTGDQKKTLLRLARRSIETYLETGKVIRDDSGDPVLLTYLGAFVTLKKHGDLRGCIGFSEPVAPLGQTVIQTAIYAATQDPRFTAVGKDELKSLDIEISVLTPLVRVADPRKIEVGRHGLLIRKSGRSGLLLPQVPGEFGWDRDRFLEQVCYKAGLPADAWRTGAELYSFEAIVFGEK